MVGLKVQQHRDPWPESIDVLELKRGQLGDDELVTLDLTVELRQRPADVAGHRGAQHEAEPFRGRRLPVRAGDTDDRVRQQPGGELDLAPNGNLALARPRDERCLSRHPRALHEQTDVAKQGDVLVVPELPIGADDLHPTPLERPRRRKPRASEPEHENAFRQTAQRNPWK